MTGTQLVIDPANHHATIFKTRVAKDDLSARVLGFRHFVRERQHRPAEYCGINSIVDERSPKRDLTPSVAGGRSEGREVARQHRSGVHERDLIGRILSHPCALVPTEEKQFVFHDRTAQRSAVLVSLDGVALGRKRISSVEFSVSHEFKQVSVKLVRA